MTTDEKADQKGTESAGNGTKDTNIKTENDHFTNDKTPNQCIDNVEKEINNKCVASAEASSDATVEEKCQNDGDNDKCDDDKCHNNDVEMKNAQSLENLCTVASSSCTNKTEYPIDLSETVNFKIIYNKTIYDIAFAYDKTIRELKDHIQTLTSVAPQLQKLVLRGTAITQEERSLRDIGIKDGVKLMLVGSKISDVINVNQPKESKDSKDEKSASVKEPLCKKLPHKKMIERGVPPEAMPAWKNGRAPLPPDPLYGMLNSKGNKVRLTFKLEQDQLWVGTKERTDKLPMANVRSIVSEPIENHEEYHIMAIQTGPTELSRIWIYWVPAQFVDAIKETILGK